jgi:uncharacterized membrane protein
MQKLVVLIILLFFQSALFAFQKVEDEPSRLLLFLGRFHVLILHLPIGALLVTFYLDIVGRVKKEYPFKTIKYGLGFSAFFAILASVLGYFLSLEGGYESNSLDLHLYCGIVTAIVISFHFYLSLKPDNFKYFLSMFVLGIISIIVTGHFGSVLTHGDDFLTEYAKAEPLEDAILEIDSLAFYDNVIAKILDDKCISCHNNTKKKGDLSLLDRTSILKGGKNGEIVNMNNSLESALYTNALLPLHDDLHMPPEGKPQLTKDEIWLIKSWIDHGLDFDNKATQTFQSDTLNLLLQKYLIIPKEQIPIASTTTISKIKDLGFQVLSVVPNEGGLSVKFVKGELSKKKIKSLLDLDEQIVELDLSNTSLKDDWTQPLKELKKLNNLRLDNTEISDGTLGYLEALPDLEVVNLYGTGVTDTGLKDLLGANDVSKVFVWNTKVDIANADALGEEFETTIIAGLKDGFIEKSTLKKPILETQQSFFKDSIVLSVKESMRGTEIRYTLDGTEPNTNSALYSEPIMIKDDVSFKAISVKEGWYSSDVLTKKFSKTGFEITNYSIVNKPHKNYPGTAKLFDRIEGSLLVKDGKWTGYNGEDLNITIDLGKIETINRLTVSCLEAVNQWVFFPKSLEVFVSDSENHGFQRIWKQTINREKDFTANSIERYVADIPETQGRYLKVVVKNFGKLPEWHPAAGNFSWLFVDEILVK